MQHLRTQPVSIRRCYGRSSVCAIMRVNINSVAMRISISPICSFVCVVGSPLNCLAPASHRRNDFG